MVQWHSPEEAEAWWEELQDLKQKITSLEKRLVNIAIEAYYSPIYTIMAITRHLYPEKWDYIDKRAAHYIKLIRKSKNEKEMHHHQDQFFEELLSYLQSG